MSELGRIGTVIVDIVGVLLISLCVLSIIGAVQQNTAVQEFALGKQDSGISVVGSGIVSKIVDSDNNIKVLVGEYKLDAYDRLWISNNKGTGKVIALTLLNGDCYTLAEYTLPNWDLIGAQTNNIVYMVKSCN